MEGQMTRTNSSLGTVFLVGAGPGDPGLLTVKALRTIEAAQVVVYDRLVSAAVMALVPKGAARFDVGKQPGAHPVPQGEINDMLVRLARGGRTVVRLKGGDPLLFGRGGEEALALAAAGIPFEVVPGITAAQACAAALCVPLTHRGMATSVRYLTGHCRAHHALDFDWLGLADARTTLVIYMGLASIAEVAANLMAHGRRPDTPVLAVSRGTLSDQRCMTSSLGALAEDVRNARLPSPVLFIVGEVVSLARLNEADPLLRHLELPAIAT
jgi:uroporphyrin-III C-methyltransferase